MGKLNIILYGKRSVGKTSTLIELAILLAGGSSIIRNSVNSQLKKGRKYIDTHFIINYKKLNVYIGTGGDTWAISRSNCDFFENNYNKLLNVYELSTTEIKKLSLSAKNHRLGTPDVCICACRPDGDKCGAIKALHSYSENRLLDYSYQIWIQIEKKDEVASKAKDILKIIDQFT